MVTIKILAIENTQKKMRKKFLNFITKKKENTKEESDIGNERQKCIWHVEIKQQNNKSKPLLISN